VTAGVAAAGVVAGSLWWQSRTAAEPEQAAPPAAGVATVRITAPETSRKSAGAGIGSDALPTASTPAGSRPEKSRQPPRGTTAPSATAGAPATPKAAVNTTRANLALNRPAASSSNEGGAWVSSNAVDGDVESRWSSGFSDPQWLRVDLGQRWEISSIRVRWERAYAVAYRMEVSTDGKTWKSVYSTTNGEGGNVTIEVAQVPGRYVRMYGTKRSGQYGYSVLELEVS
jgi:hypothetical protein